MKIVATFETDDPVSAAASLCRKIKSALTLVDPLAKITCEVADDEPPYGGWNPIEDELHR